MEGGLMAHLMMDMAIEGPLVDTLMMDEYDEDEFFDPDHHTEYVHLLGKRLCEEPSEERTVAFNRALSQSMIDMATVDPHMKGHFLMSIRRILGSDLRAMIVCPRLDWEFFARLEPFAFAFREVYQEVCKVVCNAGGPQLAWLQLTQRYIVATNDHSYNLIASYLGLLGDMVLFKRLHTSIIYDHVSVIIKRFDQWIPIMDASVMEPYPEWDEDFNVDEDMEMDEHFDVAVQMNYESSVVHNGRRDILAFLSWVAKRFAEEDRFDPKGPRQYICKTEDFICEDDTDNSLSAGVISSQEVQSAHEAAECGTAVDQTHANSTAVDESVADITAVEEVVDSGLESDSSHEKETVRQPFIGKNKDTIDAINRRNRLNGKQLLLTMLLKYLTKLFQVSNMGASVSLLRSRKDPYVKHPNILYGRYEPHGNHSLLFHLCQSIMTYLALTTQSLVNHLVSGKPKLQLSDKVNSKSCEVGVFVLLVASQWDSELQATFLREAYLTRKQFWMILPAITRLLKADKQAEGVGDLLLHCLIIHQRHLFNGKKPTSPQKQKTLKKLLKRVLDFSASCSVPSLAAAALAFVSSCLGALKREAAQREKFAADIKMDKEYYNIIPDYEDDDTEWKLDDDEDDGEDIVSKADLVWKYGPYVVSKAKNYVIHNETISHPHIVSPDFIHADDVDVDPEVSVWKATDTDDINCLRTQVERLST